MIAIIKHTEFELLQLIKQLSPAEEFNCSFIEEEDELILTKNGEDFIDLSGYLINQVIEQTWNEINDFYDLDKKICTDPMAVYHHIKYLVEDLLDH